MIKTKKKRYNLDYITLQSNLEHHTACFIPCCNIVLHFKATNKRCKCIQALCRPAFQFRKRVSRPLSEFPFNRQWSDV